MANAWITQFRSAAFINDVLVDAPDGLPLRSEKVTFTDTAAASAAIGADCGLVEIYVDTAACWSAVAVATEDDTPLGAGAAIFLVPTGLYSFSFVTQPAAAPPAAQFTPQLFLLLMGA